MRSSKYEVNPRQSKFERKLNEDSKISTEGDKKDEIKFSPNMNESTPRPNSSKSDEDEDKDDACNFCNFSFLEIISNYVNNFLQNSFYKIGLYTGTHPWGAILIGLLIFAIPLGGTARFEEETEIQKLWVPAGARSLTDQDRAEVWFPETSRICQVLIESSDVLKPDILQRALQLHERITGINAMVGGTIYAWDDLCIKTGDNCLMSSILEVWSWDNDVINDATFTQGKIETDIQNTTTSPVTGREFDVNLLLSGDPNANGGFDSSPAMIMNYFIRSRKPEDETEKEVLEWEKKFLDVCEEGIPGLDIYYFTIRSYEDLVGGAIQDGLQFLIIGYILMITYFTVALGRINCRDSKLFMAMTGVLCVAMSLGVSIGLSSLFGFFYTPVHSGLPFLLLGIGVDDMFVFVSTWDNLRPDERLLPLKEKIALMCKHAGISILITSFTDIAVFGIGATTIIPALRSFCVYAALGTLGIFLITLSFFVGVFTYDQKRAAANRNALIWCYNHGEDYQPNKCSEQSLSTKIFDQYVAKALSLLPVKIVVTVVTLGLAATGAYGFSQIEQDFQYEWLIPRGNYFYEYIQKSADYFPEDGYQGNVFFGEIDYHEHYDKLLALPDRLEALDAISAGSVVFWLNGFKAWVNSSADPAVTSCVTDGKPDSPQNLTYLANMYINGEGGAFLQDVNFENAGVDNTITSSRMMLKYKKAGNSAAGIKAMDESRAAVDELGLGKEKAFIFTIRMASWESDKVIKEELIRNIMLSFVIVLVVCLLLIANITTALLVLSCVMFTLVNVVGFSHFWDISINVVSTINLILCIGLTVDYAAHIGHAFMVASGSRKTRVRTSLREMGAAVFNGGFSTFLAFFPLCLSTSFAFSIFFKVFFLVSLFGLFHGLMFLPVALSWLGPSPYNSHKRSNPGAVNPVIEKTKPTVWNSKP